MRICRRTIGPLEDLWQPRYTTTHPTRHPMEPRQGMIQPFLQETHPFLANPRLIRTPVQNNPRQDSLVQHLAVVRLVARVFTIRQQQQQPQHTLACRMQHISPRWITCEVENQSLVASSLVRHLLLVAVLQLYHHHLLQLASRERWHHLRPAPTMQEVKIASLSKTCSKRKRPLRRTSSPTYNPEGFPPVCRRVWYRKSVQQLLPLLQPRPKLLNRRPQPAVHRMFRRLQR